MRVTSPNGGEQILASSPFIVTWDAKSEASAFSVEYSVDDGVTYTEVSGCATLVATARHCEWTAPAVTATARMRITATSMSGVKSADVSDAAFSVTLPDVALEKRDRTE